jgi:hypothetical protein
MRARSVVRPRPDSRLGWWLLLQAILLLLFALPAQAQLGRLKKMGADLAKESVGLPAKEEPKAAATNASASRGTDNLITAERLELVMTALAPMVERAKRESAARAARRDYEARHTPWKTCIETAAKKATSISEAYLTKGGDIAVRSAELMQRQVAAQHAGRDLQAAYLADSAAVISFELSALMTGAKCGPSVYMPAAVVAQEAERSAMQRGSYEIDESGRAVGNVQVPEAVRKSLTTHQFGLLRERVALYALSLDDASVKLGAFTDAEKAALATRAAELRALAPFFRDGTMRWTTWRDVKSW